MKTIAYTLRSGVTVFDIPESIVLSHVPFAETLIAEIKEHLGKGDRKFVIDLSRLNYIDSAGLGIVVSCRNLIVKAGGQVRAVTPKERVQGTFDVTRIKLFLAVDLSLDAALGALSE